MMASPMRAELSWARSLLASADLAATPVERRRGCLLAARQGAAAVLSMHRQVSPIVEPDELWARLALEVPVFVEWASYFALLEGRSRLSERQADDLLRDLTTFLDLVDRQLSRSRSDRVRYG